MSLADLKGYYRALGLEPGAPADAVKHAFRERAKEAHPDHGGGGDAFRLITEAYEVLGDESRRAAYDSLCREVRDARDTPAPVRCARCGTVSAQPRHVRVFEVVAFGRHLRQRAIAGTFCRACADRVAIRASLVTWACGWWGPRGPRASVRALLCNLAGGERPPAENAALLARQARAFASNPELASSLARQAYDFRPDPSLHALIAAGSARRLKDRWRPGGISFVVQSLPLALALAWPLVWSARKLAALLGA